MAVVRSDRLRRVEPNTETMPDDNTYGLSRRKALLGLSTIGIAGAGAGLGTSALFSDEESFTNNQLVAGELDLYVDYETDVDSSAASSAVIDGGTAGDGQIQGDVSSQYQLNDVKPGDGGSLLFCPKVVDNPAWVWVGSSGLIDFENGQTEPEAEVDDSGGDPGEGNGELSENIQVTVFSVAASAADDVVNSDGEVECDPDENEDLSASDVRELNNPDDYTLADLFKDLESGFLLDGDDDTNGKQAYPASSDSDTQEGPCICIEWEVPTDVGNEIQSDSVEFDVQFAAEQERNNPDPESPFVDATVGPSGDFSTIESAVDAAGSGDVISVASGTYQIPQPPGSTSGVLDVEGLILAGPNAGIAGDSADRGDEAVIEGPLFIGADNICVDGFEIRDTNATPTSDGLPNYGAVQLNVGAPLGDSADGAMVRNNVIVAGTNDNAQNIAIIFENVKGATVEQNLFTDGGNGVDLISGFFGNDNDVTIEDNTDNT